MSDLVDILGQMSTTRRQRGGSLKTLLLSKRASLQPDQLDELVDELKEEFGTQPTLRVLLANLEYLPNASQKQLINWTQDWFDRHQSSGGAPLNPLARGHNLNHLIQHPQADTRLWDTIAERMGELSADTSIEPTLIVLAEQPHFWNDSRTKMMAQNQPVQVFETLFSRLDDNYPAEGRETAFNLLVQKAPGVAFKIMRRNRHQTWLEEKHWARLLKEAGQHLRPQIMRHRGRQPRRQGRS